MTIVDRAAAAPPDPERNAQLRALSRQLESVFVRMMFEEMAKTVHKSDLFPAAPGSDLYEQWFRSEIADRFTAGGGTGLGDAIAARLGVSEGEGVQERWARAQRVMQAPAVPGPLPSRLGGPPLRTPAPAAPDAPGRITSHFGPRRHPITGRPDHHRGVDVATPLGTEVRSPFEGVVESIGHNDKLGRFVWVQHANGFSSVFGHLEGTQLEPGARVRAGQTIATSGNSGRSTGPHLHYGLYRNREAVDPRRYIDALGETLLSTPRHRPKK
jgi:murein DD-endopeptidase MepM/ murein hydrolase activator NlpD